LTEKQQAEVCAGQLDPAQQAAFPDEYEKLKKTKGENDPITLRTAVIRSSTVFRLTAGFAAGKKRN
jgi:hypothetical protein